jgi:hypothetical protein
VKGNEDEQEGKQHDKRRAEPTVTPPALEHLAQPNHGRGW